MRFSTFIVMFVIGIGTAGCGGGGSDNPVEGIPNNMPSEDDINPGPFDQTANYSVTVENYWGVDDFPQGYPVDAHLSLFGGAVHNQSVSFWNPGEIAEPGIVQMAETGLTDILLQDEVGPEIQRGTADSTISHITYTDPPNGDIPGTQTFPVEVSMSHPLVTLVSMLGPSPDWFVGVSGLSLLDESTGWLSELSVDLPLYDGGTRSNITPVMFGLAEDPPKAIALVGYDIPTGTYRPTDTEQIVAKLKFVRIMTQ